MLSLRSLHASALVVVFASLFLLSCNIPAKITITSPIHGDFIDAGSVLVTGTTNKYKANYIVRVNGVVTTLNPNKTWSITVPLDSAAVVNPILAELETGTHTRQDRVTVVAGPSVADGTNSVEGVGLRFNNTGLEAVAPLVESLAGGAFDLGSIILSQNPLVENETFFTFEIDANAYEASSGSFSLDLAAQAAGHTDVTVTVEDLHLGLVLDITDDLAINMSCTMELDIDEAVISGSYDMIPDATDPALVDVNEVGLPSVVLNGVNYLFISGACDPDAPVIGGLINAILAAAGTIETLMADGFQQNLGDPDGAGPLDGPIAAGIQQALAGISIAGEVSAAVGVELTAPFFQIAEDADGIFLGADAGFTTAIGTGPGECDPPPGAPDFFASYDVPTTAMGFGPLTPLGAPYSLGLGISASAFNQLLKSTVECGLLTLELSEVVFAGIPTPITAGTLGLLGIPEFAAHFGSGYPLELHITPTMAPLVTADPGPAGEMAELVLPHLLLDVVDPSDEKLWLSLAIDTRMGFELVFDAVASALSPTLSPPAVADTQVQVVSNEIGTNPLIVEQAIPVVFPTFFAAFSDLFGTFPLPTFLGLGLDVVEIDRSGGYFRLFTNLAVTPTTRLYGPTLTDLSPADFVEDGVFDTWEWRHRSALTNGTTSIGTRFQGVVAVDACCTLDDEELAVTPKYQVAFDVIPENGEAWQLDIDHSFLGALTLVDEANALYDGSELAQITTPIQGSYSLNGGAFQAFDFNVGPVSSVFDDFGGAENDASVEISGANAVSLCGTVRTQVVLEFEFGTFVKSDSNLVLPAIDGGEAAVRFGVHDSIELGTDPSPGFTAGNYPGLGGREISLDGHFANVTLTPIAGPCP